MQLISRWVLPDRFQSVSLFALFVPFHQKGLTLGLVRIEKKSLSVGFNFVLNRKTNGLKKNGGNLRAELAAAC